MNLHVLNQTVSTQFAEIAPRVNAVFDHAIRAVETRGGALNVQSFLTRMNRALKGTRITVARELTDKFGLPEDTQGRYYPAMGGFCFEPAFFKNEARIKLILCIHPGTNRMPLNVDALEFFRYRFLKCLSHELVHRAQFKNGRKLHNALIFRPHALPNLPKAVLQEQAYLGDMDEVEAYAHDCVEEWYYLNPDVRLTMRAIKKEFRNKGGRIPSVQYYFDGFFGDERHPSVQRFFRKVKKWDELIYPMSYNLPSPPSYVRRNAKTKRDVRLG